MTNRPTYGKGSKLEEGRASESMTESRSRENNNEKPHIERDTIWIEDTG